MKKNKYYLFLIIFKFKKNMLNFFVIYKIMISKYS